MRAKEYLNQVGVINAKLKVIDATVDKIRRELYELDDISLSSVWGDGQPHSTVTSDPTGRKAVQLADKIDARKDELKTKLVKLEYEQIAMRSQLWSKRMEIIEKLEGIVTDEPMSKVYYQILIMRYVHGNSWEQIAVDIHYTIRHTWRLHGEALRRMEQLL